MTGVLLRREKFGNGQVHRKKEQHVMTGRDWSDDVITKKRQGLLAATRNLEKAGRTLLQRLQRQRGPGDPSISEVSTSNCEITLVCILFHPTWFVVLCYP